MADSNSSNRRAFYCQDTLWQAFSDLSMTRGCAIDTLINEAMSAYIQNNSMAQNAYGMDQNAYGMDQNAYGMDQNAYGMDQNAYGRQAVSTMPPRPTQAPGYGMNTTPPASPYAGAAAPNITAPQGGRVPPPTPNNSYRRPPSIFDDSVAEPPQPMALASLSQPPQQTPAQRQYAQQPAVQNYSQPPLYIIFANQRYTVDKDKYIIGRSSQLADLVIRDGNISRKHCAIIYKNGAYYIKDLDSTNGIEYKGNRIDTKRIDEGDQFNICEFYFTFTYR